MMSRHGHTNKVHRMYISIRHKMAGTPTAEGCIGLNHGRYRILDAPGTAIPANVQCCPMCSREDQSKHTVL